MLKKITIGCMLFFMAVSIPVYIPSCSRSPNSPQNAEGRYSVAMIAVNMGGISGCGSGVSAVVRYDSAHNNTFTQVIKDADVEINSVKLICDTNGGNYTISDSIISIDSGTQYSLTVKHAGVVIATGSAIMPSEPTILSPANGSQHQTNTDLPVSWAIVKNATSIFLSIHYSDSLTPDTTIYSTTGLPPTDTTFTVPASVFYKLGIYYIHMFATYGLPVGIQSPLNYYSLDSTKSYNISGAAGMCVAANFQMIPDTIRVNY
ncbi:MAG: hypothetical protein ABSF80_06440 [Chitinispirillaceae bacterium]|jgi:hypothetical protein